ncbi:MAG: transporter [Frankiales bacterium]|nr:transporter [Frankiales bacterium]
MSFSHRGNGAAASSGTMPLEGARPKMPPEARLLFIGLFLSVASNNLFTPLLPDIQHSMGKSASAIGAFVSAYGLARLIVDLPSGAMTSRMGPRRVVTIGVLLNAGSSAAGIFAPNFESLIAARVGSGVGAGLLATVVLSGLSDIAPVAIRGRVMSLYQVANNLGIAVYPLIGGVVGSAWGWRSAYGVAVVASLLSGLTLAPLLGSISAAAMRSAAEKAAGGKQAGASDAGVAASTSTGRRAILLSGTSIAFAAIFFGVFANMVNRHGFRNTVLPLFAESSVHLSPVQTATGVTLMSLVGIAVTIPGAVLGDRIGRKKIVVAGLLILAAGDLFFPVLATNYWSYILAAMLVGTGDFFSSSQTALLSDLVSGPRRAMVLGGYRFFVDLGALIGPSALGWIYGGYGARAAMTVAAVILFAAAIINLVGVPRRALT